jgi:hypothetical protein
MNLRLKACLGGAPKSNERVELHTLEFEPLQVNMLTLSTESLGDTHVRRMHQRSILAELQASRQPVQPVILSQVFVQNDARSEKRLRDTVGALRKLGSPETTADLPIAVPVAVRVRAPS